MNIQLIATLLNMLLAVIPQINDSKTVASVIAWLQSLIPQLVDAYQNLLPIVTRIIGLLKQNSAVTPDQLASLKEMDAQIDKAHDDALTAYLANHPDPAPPASAS